MNNKNIVLILPFLVVILAAIIFIGILQNRSKQLQISDQNSFITEYSDGILQYDTEEAREASNLENYIGTQLHRGFFVDYNRNTEMLTIQKESISVEGTITAETMSYKVPIDQPILCWPATKTIPSADGTNFEMKLSETYIPLEPGGNLYLAEERNSVLSQELNTLFPQSYIFIHLSNNVISNIAIAGCL